MEVTRGAGPWGSVTAVRSGLVAGVAETTPLAEGRTDFKEVTGRPSAVTRARARGDNAGGKADDRPRAPRGVGVGVWEGATG